MKTPCELVVGKILPSLRASVVKDLTKRHGLRQSEIAKRMGVTQASVSQYLSSARAGNKKVLEDFPQILTYAEEISERIMAGEAREEWCSVLCSMCKNIREDDEFCRMHMVASKLRDCDICHGK
ncbi:MAG: transcriptional regulator [Methanobacteriota archaeon]|nr:MAG: transcriptional regulator [Euryarchaeota archaeon]